MRLRSSRPQGRGVGGRERVTAEPSPYGTTPRRTGMPRPTSTFVDAFTGYLQTGRKTRGYLALFAIVICFGFIAASVLRFFIEQYDEMRQRAMDRPALIERRPVDAGDLDYYSLHAFYDSFYRRQTSIKLVRDRGVTRLLITSRRGDVLLKRRLVPSDLDHQRILARHADKTGDTADTVDLYYKDGQAMLVVKSSDFDL